MAKGKAEAPWSQAGAPDVKVLPEADVEAGEKVVWFVRHAESENNVSKRLAMRALRARTWPSWEEWKKISPMLLFPMDTPLSADGRGQASRQAAALQAARFVESQRIQLVVHSHLQRARETCLTLFASSGVPIEEHAHLYEKSLSEHCGQHVGCASTMKPRVDGFVAWLRGRRETEILLVGHSGFFRCMFRPERGVDNAAVWRAVMTTAPDGTPAFRGVMEVYPGLA
mmetsp:Transcript_57840/g.163240  ORF Transcript_57840/g.163240 Transcript_57840/m.163240 type:complete len:227 (+) Transcript_57840:41-721(+)